MCPHLQTSKDDLQEYAAGGIVQRIKREEPFLRRIARLCARCIPDIVFSSRVRGRNELRVREGDRDFVASEG